MAAGLPRPSVDENISTTLSAGITDVATSMDVADASKIVSPCYLVIDRVDSSGTLKSTTLWEYVKVTNVAGNTLTITRQQGGSTNQAHGSGAIVEAVVTSSFFEDWYNVLNPEHDSSGGHVIVGTMTVAGINLASVATIAVAGIGTLRTTSEIISTHLSVSGASISGIGLNPTWYIPSLPSLPTTSLGRPATMPRAGLLQFVNVTLNGIVSSPTVFFDVKKNFTSIFDTACRPLIANGTFASTASIATKNFKAGDVFTVDYAVCDLGGNSVDATVTASSY
jgi:hypothetical protein